MHPCKRTALDTRPLGIGSTLLVIAAALHCASSAHAAAGAPGNAPAAAATQRSDWSSRWYARAPEAVTGKLTKSPVLGPAEQDGVMGGRIPSALPGWQPDPRDAQDGYVFVPGQGWLQGDTRAERQR